MAIKIDSLVEQVTKVTSVSESAIALIGGISDELRALRAELAATPEIQARVDDLANQLAGNASALAAAVVANTTPPQSPADQSPADQPPADQPPA